MTAIVLEQVINGLLVGSYYIVLALGLSMIFSLGGVVNLAHGAFYAVGAYFAYEIQKFAGFGGAVVLSPICVALLGVAIERSFLQRFYREDKAIAVDERTVIENHKCFRTIAVVSIQIVNITALKAKDLIVRRIDYDFDLLRPAAA